MHWTTHVLFLHWVWHSIVFGGRSRGKKKTACVGGLESIIQMCHSSILWRPTIHTWLERVERFIVLLYYRTSSQVSVNDARMQLFTQREQTIDGMPPTKAALATYYESCLPSWTLLGSSNNCFYLELPSPSEWGLNKNTYEEAWKVHWTNLLEATQACRELIQCGCKKGCMQRMLQVIESYSWVHCTWICFCGELCSDWF